MDGEPVIRRDVAIEGEPFALVVQTRHGDAVATTAIHRQAFERRMGGARFVPAEGDGPRDGLAEVGHLSSAMTEKALAAMIPADGQKTVIVAPPEVVGDEDRKVAILAEHIRAVVAEDPGATFGPDINVGEEIQDRLAAEPDLLDHVTGLSTRARGLSIDRYGYTAEGVVQSIRVALGGRVRGVRVSVQGFGAVGAHAARLLGEAGARLVVASNARGTLIAGDNGDLDAAELFSLWQARGDDSLAAYRERHPDVGFATDPDVLLDVPVDVFVPAARTSVLAMADELDGIRRAENPHVRDAVEFHRRTGARLIAEGANHPLSENAELYLEEQGVRILPDYIVNCGGLIGCRVEWEERRKPAELQDLDGLARAALERIHRTIDTNVGELLVSEHSARNAAKEIVRRNRGRLQGHDRAAAR
jgi:glutamate dehydrogenase (NAD(P)+)